MYTVYIYIVLRKTKKKYTDTQKQTIYLKKWERKNREIVLCVIAFNVSCRYLLVAAAAVTVALLFSLNVFARSQTRWNETRKSKWKERITTNQCSVWRDRFFNKLCENFVIYWSLRWTYEKHSHTIQNQFVNIDAQFWFVFFFFFLSFFWHWSLVFIQNLTRENKRRNNRIRKDLERKTKKSISKKVFIFVAGNFLPANNLNESQQVVSVFIANCDLFK